MTTKQRAMIVMLDKPSKDFEIALNELISLIETAHGEYVGCISQKKLHQSNATLVGSGKLDEIKQYIEENDIDLAVFDDRLSATQRRNISEVIGIDIIDKVDLILDIFAQRAISKDGKQQVELAQLQYSLATRDSSNNERQGGGIGSRGPGETKLETNKRIIRNKINFLRGEIAKSTAIRNTQLKSRKDNNLFTVALVGYTNAGKSTLFNRLTNNEVLAKDMLFATLDTTTRKLQLPCGITVILSDTVGFIRDLPHELISAFKSTLDESIHADLVLVINDVSSEYLEEQHTVCHNLLSELQCTGNVVDVFNKIDCVQAYVARELENSLSISARTGKGIDNLLEFITTAVMQRYQHVTLHCPYGKEQIDTIALLNKYNITYDIGYFEEFLMINAILPNELVDYISNRGRIEILTVEC